jgi:hypothetical protein
VSASLIDVFLVVVLGAMLVHIASVVVLRASLRTQVAVFRTLFERPRTIAPGAPLAHKPWWLRAKFLLPIRRAHLGEMNSRARMALQIAQFSAMLSVAALLGVLTLVGMAFWGEA